MSRPGASSNLAATDWNDERDPGRRLRLVTDPQEVSGSIQRESAESRGVRAAKNIWNALGYNLFWWIGVSSAARGDVWTGVVSMAIFVGIALWWTPPRARAADLRFLFLVMAVGWGLDSLMHNVGVLRYPSSEAAWSWSTAPPWIAALWLGFATMPRFSLAWLKRRGWWWSAVLGGFGGPLAFYAGTKLAAIEPGLGARTYVILACEYAVLTLWMVRTHGRRMARIS